MEDKFIQNINTHRVEAYKSIGNVTREIFVHIVLREHNDKDKCFEHIISDLDELTKSLRIIQRFSIMTTKTELQSIQQKLEEFISFGEDKYTVERYEGYTNDDIWKNIVDRIDAGDVIDSNENWLYISVETVTELVKDREVMFNRPWEGVILELMYDGYLVYCTDDDTGNSCYKIKNLKE